MKKMSKDPVVQARRNEKDLIRFIFLN